MGEVVGGNKILRSSERNELERISSRRFKPEQLIDADLARRTAKVAAQLGVQIGLLVERDGSISHVVVGTRERIYLPDLGRFRLDPTKLRRLRLIVFAPSVRYAEYQSDFGLIRRFADIQTSRATRIFSPFIADDFYTDLEKLRLDAIAVVAVEDDGSTGAVSLAFLEPVPERTLEQKGQRRRQVATLAARDIFELSFSFPEFVARLENEIARGVQRLHRVGGELAVLVGAYTGRLEEAEASMAELSELAMTANLVVADKFVQRRRSLDPRTVIGKGKIEQIVLECLKLGADLIVFDRELSPGQLRTITNLTELRILDRSMLILDIFAQRAKTSEGKLQVELAQLKYSLPRLTEKDSGLSRLTGGIGGRGPGETKLEISRRRARDRIADLEKRIDKVSSQRAVQRNRRVERGVPVIAIVGYTNSGKSTLLNALTKGDVLVENKLFATLDPSSRRMRFPNDKEVVFVDTVGFIRELPKELIAAFRATLEEVGAADVLIHLVDASDLQMRNQIEVVTSTLTDLGFDTKPRILVLNKIDLLSEIERKSVASALEAISVSAMTREGFPELLHRCQDALAGTFKGLDPGHFVSQQI